MTDQIKQRIQLPPLRSTYLAEEAARILRKCRRQVSFRAVRAAGPGGQNVNKVSTAVQLRFDARNCAALTPAARRRLSRLGGKRFTAGGVLLIHSDSHRSQLENKKQAIRELKDILARSLSARRARVPTHPTKAAREKRLRSKKQRSRVKRARSGADLE